MDRWEDKIAVVTGASSGIGLQITKILVAKGMKVVGLARRKEKMEKEIQNSGGKFYAYSCDISKEDEVDMAFDWIKTNLGLVQVLINNAGICVPGGFNETDSELWRSTVDLNIMGNVYCSTRALVMMKEASEGHIININSVQGHRVYKFGGNNYNIQPSTKHAITGLTETLQRELIGLNIRVTSISPGVVATDMLKADGMEGFVSQPALEANDIAEAVLYVLGTPLRVQITELTIRPLGEQSC